MNISFVCLLEQNGRDMLGTTTCEIAEKKKTYTAGFSTFTKKNKTFYLFIFVMTFLALLNFS